MIRLLAKIKVFDLFHDKMCMVFDLIFELKIYIKINKIFTVDINIYINHILTQI